MPVKVYKCMCLTIVPGLKKRSVMVPYFLGVQTAIGWMKTTWCIKVLAIDNASLSFVFPVTIKPRRGWNPEVYNRFCFPNYYALLFVREMKREKN